MYEETTAVCGCRVSVDAYTYVDGCCDLCYSTAVEVEEVVILEACADHGGEK